EPTQRVAHGGQVDDAGHAGEVLHEDALGSERDLGGRVAGALAVGLGVGAPGRHRRNVVGRDVRPVLVTEQVFQHDLYGVRQPGDVVARGQRLGGQGED